ncbi:hypothetical protein QE152_g26837 [Popillia japonica]|uniref:Uncharacterized protein n=1 Tax=Popillia japonica TaxID=7064 RepID=A0AAW1JVJ6_POPJA
MEDALASTSKIASSYELWIEEWLKDENVVHAIPPIKLRSTPSGDNNSLQWQKSYLTENKQKINGIEYYRVISSHKGLEARETSYGIIGLVLLISRRSKFERGSALLPLQSGQLTTLVRFRRNRCRTFPTSNIQSILKWNTLQWSKHTMLTWVE